MYKLTRHTRTFQPVPSCPAVAHTKHTYACVLEQNLARRDHGSGKAQTRQQEGEKRYVRIAGRNRRGCSMVWGSRVFHMCFCSVRPSVRPARPLVCFSWPPLAAWCKGWTAHTGQVRHRTVWTVHECEEVTLTGCGNIRPR